MRYQGGKKRPGPRIAEVIVLDGLGAIGATGVYREPFMGAAGVARHVAPYARIAVLADAQEDLVMLWRALCYDGWTPPDGVTEEEHRALKRAEPSALRGFVGFGCSFGGKWFGGYARPYQNGKLADYRDSAAGAKELVAKAADLKRAGALVIKHGDYSITAFPAPGDTVYCDPPYAGTAGYKGVPGTFDHDRFWRVMTGFHVAGAHVFVSEFTAPDGWRPARGWTRDQSMRGVGDHKSKIDTLWVHE